MHPDQEHIRGEAYTVGAKKKFTYIYSYRVHTDIYNTKTIVERKVIYLITDPDISSILHQ